MGSDLDEATKILKVCRERKLKAAVNFQLRFSPMMLAVKDAVDRGLFGRLLDVEVRVSIDTPWRLFAFLKGLPRIEIAVHSIHYLDLIRGFLGDPSGVHAKTIGHPSSEMAQTRTAAILDYRRRDPVRDVGQPQPRLRPQAPGGGVSVRGVGRRGARQDGRAARLSARRAGRTHDQGERRAGLGPGSAARSWFPDAFVGRMANLQRFVAGEDKELIASVEDAWTTMALVEAAFESSARPATPLREHP